MRLYLSTDRGATWRSLGSPFIGPYGGMQAIYQMCVTESNAVFAACQPDSTILKLRMSNSLKSRISRYRADYEHAWGAGGASVLDRLFFRFRALAAELRGLARGHVDGRRVEDEF